eukprot:COSAG06_NODE_29768_length_550_cov_1.658537_2_plen_32_part_01
MKATDEASRSEFSAAAGEETTELPLEELEALT